MKKKFLASSLTSHLQVLTIILLAWINSSQVAQSAGNSSLSEKNDNAAKKDWAQAVTPWDWAFPRDHGQHPDYRTEWWYYTGNLKEVGTGRHFGYQFTIFRYGIVAEPAQTRSAWAMRDVWFAHFAVSDIEGGEFYFSDVVERGSLGLAGASEEDMKVWIRDWQIEPLGQPVAETPQPAQEITSGGLTANAFERAAAQALPLPFEISGEKELGFRILAQAEDYGLELELRPGKPKVFHGPGDTGLSQKSAEVGNASHYYAFTRLLANGTVRIGERTFEVEGTSWFDHEFSTSALAENQDGWDWFSLQLDDNTELMVYGMRQDDGSVDPSSKGSFIYENGSKTHLKREDFTIKPTGTWKSATTGAEYPSGWEVSVPKLDLALTVTPMMKEQELALTGLLPIAYWEGACRVKGQRAGREVGGYGYVELSGYAEALGAGMKR